MCNWNINLFKLSRSTYSCIDILSLFQFYTNPFFSFPRSSHTNATLHEKKLYSGKCCERSLHRESISFMKGVMDECTHMANFSGKFSIEGRIKGIFSNYARHTVQRKADIMSTGDATVHPKYNRMDCINGLYYINWKLVSIIKYSRFGLLIT